MTNRFVHHVPFPYIDVMRKKGRMKGLMCLINLYELRVCGLLISELRILLKQLVLKHIGLISQIMRMVNRHNQRMHWHSHSQHAQR